MSKRVSYCHIQNLLEAANTLFPDGPTFDIVWASPSSFLDAFRWKTKIKVDGRQHTILLNGRAKYIEVAQQTHQVVVASLLRWASKHPNTLPADAPASPSELADWIGAHLNEKVERRMQTVMSILGVTEHEVAA